VNLIEFLVANPETSLFEEPGKRSLDHITVFAEAASMFGIPFGDDGFDPAFSQRLADFFFGIVGSIRQESRRSFSGPTVRSLDGVDPVDKRHGRFGIMHVRPGLFEGERNTVRIR